MEFMLTGIFLLEFRHLFKLNSRRQMSLQWTINWMAPDKLLLIAKLIGASDSKAQHLTACFSHYSPKSQVGGQSGHEMAHVGGKCPFGGTSGQASWKQWVATTLVLLVARVGCLLVINGQKWAVLW